MLRNVFAKSIFERRRSMLWWTISLVALVVLLVSFYPSIRDNPALAESLKTMPKELLAAVGIADVAAIVTPTGYLNGRAFGFIVPLLMLIFAIGMGTRSIAGEEEARTLDLLLAHPVRRRQVVIQSFGAQAALLGVLGLALFAAVALSAASVDMAIPLGKLAAVSLTTTLLALVFGTLALALGALTGKRGLTMGVSTALAVITYFLNSLGPLVAWLEPFQRISPFYYALAHDPLVNGLDLADTGVLLLVMAALVGGAVVAFERRDLAV